MLSREIKFNPKEVAVCGLLLLAVALVFGQTIRHEFIILDDPLYVYQNPIVSQGLTASGITQAFTTGWRSAWIPVTWISLMIDWELYDVHAGGYHLTNVLLHAATAMLLFIVLHRMTNRIWPSAFVAALFAIHPLRVESVAWVTERKDVLSGMFFILTLWAYLGYVRHPRFSLARYALVAILLALGLMAKPMLVTLPFVLLLLDYWPLGRMDSVGQGTTPPDSNGKGRSSFSVFLRLVLEKVPLFIIVGGDCLMTFFVQKHSTATTLNEFLPLSWRLGTALISYLSYLEMFFYPVGLVIVYPREGPDLPTWKLAAASLLLVGATAAVFIGRRRCPYLVVGWLWYLVMLVPVIGVFQFGVATLADRFTYLPQIGLAIALTWGAADLCHSWPSRRWLCGGVAALVLAVLMTCAFRQTTHWRNDESLWTETIKHSPHNALAHSNFGLWLLDEGRNNEAIDQLGKALEIEPNRVKTQFSMGLALMKVGQLDQAKVHLAKAIQCDPNCTPAYDQMGILLTNTGQLDDAISFFQKSLDVNRRNPETQYDLAKALQARGRTDEAAKHIHYGEVLAPNYAENHNRLGVTHAIRGRFDDAIEEFQRAVDAKPDYMEARGNLARSLVDSGRVKEAIAQYEAILKIEPDNAEAKNSLTELRAKH